MYYGVPTSMFCIRAIAIFSLYISLPLNNIIGNYLSNFTSVKYQLFAHDIQLYIELPVISNSSDNVAIINCINMVTNCFFFLQNSLMLNMDKTQLLNIYIIIIIIIKSDLAIAWVKEEAELIKSFTLL